MLVVFERANIGKLYQVKLAWKGTHLAAYEARLFLKASRAFFFLFASQGSEAADPRSQTGGRQCERETGTADAAGRERGTGPAADGHRRWSGRQLKTRVFEKRRRGRVQARVCVCLSVSLSMCVGVNQQSDHHRPDEWRITRVDSIFLFKQLTYGTLSVCWGILALTTVRCRAARDLVDIARNLFFFSPSRSSPSARQPRTLSYQLHPAASSRLIEKSTGEELLPSRKESFTFWWKWSHRKRLQRNVDPPASMCVVAAHGNVGVTETNSNLIPSVPTRLCDVGSNFFLNDKETIRSNYHHHHPIDRSPCSLWFYQHDGNVPIT